jgi:hypothetical protein
MIVSTASVFCDLQGRRCNGWIAQTTEGASAARREAKAAGWERIEVGGKWLDVCPTCNAEGNERIMELIRGRFS